MLNLTQHIEDGFERKEITGVAFVDLTAAYNTVNCVVTLKCRVGPIESRKIVWLN